MRNVASKHTQGADEEAAERKDMPQATIAKWSSLPGLPVHRGVEVPEQEVDAQNGDEGLQEVCFWFCGRVMILLYGIGIVDVIFKLR